MISQINFKLAQEACKRRPTNTQERPRAGQERLRQPQDRPRRRPNPSKNKPSEPHELLGRSWKVLGAFLGASWAVLKRLCKQKHIFFGLAVVLLWFRCAFVYFGCGFARVTMWFCCAWALFSVWFRACVIAPTVIRRALAPITETLRLVFFLIGFGGRVHFSMDEIMLLLQLVCHEIFRPPFLIGVWVSVCPFPRFAGSWSGRAGEGA